MINPQMLNTQSPQMLQVPLAQGVAPYNVSGSLDTCTANLPNVQLLNSFPKTATEETSGSTTGTVLHPTREYTSDPNRSLKLEMEEFLDLTDFHSPEFSSPLAKKSQTMSFATNADELNTPVYELNRPFDFIRSDSEHYKNQSTAVLNNNHINTNFATAKRTSKITRTVQPTLERDFSSPPWESVFENMPHSPIESTNHPSILSTYNPIPTTIANINNNTPYDEEDVTNMATVNSFSDILVTSAKPNAEMSCDIEKSVSRDTPSEFYPIDESGDTDLMQSFEYCIEDCDIEEIDADSPEMTEVLYEFEQKKPEDSYVFDTPEDSNASSAPRASPKLKIDINAANAAFISPNEENIKTSEIVDTLAKWDFNIMTYLDNNDVKVDFPMPLQQEDDITSNTSQGTNRKGSKRRRNYESDEDYVPPIKISNYGASTSSSYIKVEVDSDDSCVSIPAPKKRRGRPPKASSLTSNSYENTPDAKYRELRDKNNEASRKSRLKRKEKDHHLETEKEDLETRNVKLNVQVEEIQKQIDFFKKKLLPG